MSGLRTRRPVCGAVAFGAALLFTAVLGTAVLGGCVTGPERPPTAPLAERYTQQPLPARTAESPGAPGTAGSAQTFAAGVEPHDQWWRDFGAAAIDQLVAQGLAANPSLRAARETLGSAHELALAGRGALWPAVDAEVDAGRERYNEAYAGAASSQSLYNTFGARVSASYAVDLFGRQREVIRSLDADAAFATENLRAARLAVAADIVSSVITLAALDAEIAATEALIRADEETLGIVRKRLDLGHASMLEVLSQQAELDQTRATISPLRLARVNTRDALAVLIGVAPSGFEPELPALDELTLPRELPISLPARVLAARPDVRAEDALVRAASAQVGVATADLLPQFSLTAAIGSQTNAAGELARGPYGVWDVGGQLLQPLFRGGELRHRRRSAIHLYEAAAARYQAAVLAALENVARVLTAVQEDAELTRVAVDGADAAERALVLARQSFAHGGTSYVQLLLAEQVEQRARLAAIRAESSRFTDVVALYQALGGGRPDSADAADTTTAQR
jgi:NodT family efflux transporter outer membrane factor (OMF) lipoprotein